MNTHPKAVKIKKAGYVRSYILKLQFSDGTVQAVDFGPFLRRSLHPEIKKYLNLRTFKQFSVASGDLMWGDFDLVFPIMDLYTNTIERKKKVDLKKTG